MCVKTLELMLTDKYVTRYFTEMAMLLLWSFPSQFGLIASTIFHFIICPMKLKAF